MPKYLVVSEGEFTPNVLAPAIKLRPIEINPETRLGSTPREMQMVPGESVRVPYYTPYRTGRVIR